MSYGLELRDSALQLLHLFLRRFECRLQLLRMFHLPSQFRLSTSDETVQLSDGKDASLPSLSLS